MSLEDNKPFIFFLNKFEVIDLLYDTYSYSIDKKIYKKDIIFRFDDQLILKTIELVKSFPNVFEYKTNVKENIKEDKIRFYLNQLQQDNGFSLQEFLVGGMHQLYFYRESDNTIHCKIRINESSEDVVKYFKDFELISQTDYIQLNIIKSRYFNIERAKINFKITGQKGEELIAQYLDRKKIAGSIANFTWVNQSRESSLPYDFQILQNDGLKIFTDVKTTAFDFNQKIILSNNEFNFINQNPNNYHIYRCNLPLVRNI
ncbi:DUF3883 domain-containing protein [Empedobacter sedimenti]|uniref:DUF3883 domain-containing protein n=1 Tax=Empedobacter sedimenti TaxID=3042610 RepID=UPI0024A73852|nr:DUF3883 domain-containing protein [Empedobacter sedimenti]